MTKRQRAVWVQIKATRACNNGPWLAMFKLAGATPSQLRQMKAKRLRNNDRTMDAIARAMDVPDRARPLLLEIRRLDREIVRLTGELAK